VSLWRAHGRWLLLLLAALLPRLWQPGRFITPDEVLFLDHARDFLRGLAAGDSSLTLGIGYPGVTLAWANLLGLLSLLALARLGWSARLPGCLSLGQFLDAAGVQPLPYYVAGRVVSALLTTALLLLFYSLARRLLAGRGRGGEDAAWLGSLLLALDPYVLGYSRLMHVEAPLALLMLLAVLTWLLWLRDGARPWLLLAGLFSGLALLTKTTALLLVPILPALALIPRTNSPHSKDAIKDESPDGARADSPRARPGRVVAGWLAVLGLTALVFYLLWPAMWRQPGEALMLTFGKLWVDKDAGEGNLGMFWMGRFVEDPGPAFYPVALLLKLSPVMLGGLIVNLVSLRPRRERYVEWSLWGYALLYLLAMTLASKKSVRYLLPAFPAFAPLAALGLLRAGRWLAGLRLRPALADGIPQRGWGLALGALLAVFCLAYAPYYLSYYNPLLLGWRWAPRSLLVGWGEGLDAAARYLNSRPGAREAEVAAWYDGSFAPFFEGQTLPFSTENALRADYSVLYVNQVQRDIPDPNLVAYFQRRRPEHVVRLNGVDYAWVYPAISGQGPVPDTVTRVGMSMGGAVTLEGYETRPADTEQGVRVTLYWRVLRSGLPDYFVYVRAVDAAGEIRARSDSPPVMGFWPTSRWEEGSLVADEQLLVRSPEAAPGTYRLEVGMYDPVTWAVLEPAGGELGQGGGLLLGEVALP
jgi:hypothetical protein